MYLFTPGPVHKVLKDYIMRDEVCCWDKLSKDSTPSSYTETSNKTITLNSSIEEGEASVTYSLKVKNKND
jgi:hypothetical protein